MPNITTEIKSIVFLRSVLLAASLCLAVSCAQVPPPLETVRSCFHEAAAADFVLHFYTWHSMYVMRPDTRQNGFLPLFNRESIATELRWPDIKRGLAVVVVGCLLSPTQEVELFRDWKAFLNQRGFRRVVFLRGSGTEEIDGLPIESDSAIAGGA